MTLAKRVYEKLKEVPLGKVTTYKLLAEAVGTKAYRAVGQILSRNPYAPLVPCHRVVATSGQIGGFKGKKTGKEIKEKLALLIDEGIQFENGRVLDFETKLYRF
jgi:methylated-DNA-[protein]-cysteine S-methyltransferase